LDVVRQQVYKEKITTNIIDDYNELVKKYFQNKAVPIACTELSIALKINKPNIFDMVDLQVNAIKTALSDQQIS